ncbi:hypothetical protein [Legionella cherrii]|uniref:Uncharacterized protein n=1 Tax=Legionella cherrii TaxID=28084 RepID=A0ABY6T9J7_9GAMM|nr:hypothetical protein [Legionella cherrii]VEB38191.1 Uncharacterised protein [Legionella cherrii]
MFFPDVFVRKYIHCNGMEIDLKPRDNPSLTERYIHEIRHLVDSIVVAYLRAPLEQFFFVLRCFSGSQLSPSLRSFNFPLTLFGLDIYFKDNFYFGALWVKRMMSAIESGLFEFFSKGHLGQV